MKIVDNMYILRIVSECKKHSIKKEILNIGSGDCATDYHLIQEGFDVISTDYLKADKFEKNMVDYKHHIKWQQANILDLKSFSVDSREIVLCMEVLEHLVDYKIAFENLLKLADKTLIIGVPWKHSFNHPAPPPEGHCNWWDIGTNPSYKDAYEFEEMCKPHSFYVEKILTCPEDGATGQGTILMVINKKLTDV